MNEDHPGFSEVPVIEKRNKNSRLEQLQQARNATKLAEDFLKQQGHPLEDVT